MRLPDFVILGAMKAGSTSLFRWLEAHPQVALPADKEPAFYSRDAAWQRGLTPYAELFAALPSGKLTGEASVHYSDPAVAERAARRLHAVAPETQLLFLARDPAERLRSHYRHQVQRGREKRPLLEALADLDSPYVRCSLYPTAIKPWVERFGRERLLLVSFESLTAADDHSWLAVLRFLNLAPMTRPLGAHNVTAEKRGYSGLMRHAYDLGLARYEKRIPRELRSLLKPLAFRAGRGYERLLASSRDPLPSELEARLRDSFEQLKTEHGPLT